MSGNLRFAGERRRDWANAYFAASADCEYPVRGASLPEDGSNLDHEQSTTEISELTRERLEMTIPDRLCPSDGDHHV